MQLHQSLQVSHLGIHLWGVAMVFQSLEVVCTLRQRFTLCLVQLTGDVDQPSWEKKNKYTDRVTADKPSFWCLLCWAVLMTPDQMWISWGHRLNLIQVKELQWAGLIHLQHHRRLMTNTVDRMESAGVHETHTVSSCLAFNNRGTQICDTEQNDNCSQVSVVIFFPWYFRYVLWFKCQKLDLDIYICCLVLPMSMLTRCLLRIVS